MSTPPDQWHRRADADRRNMRHAYRGAYYDFPTLRAMRDDFSTQIDVETQTQRYQKCQRALDELADRYARCEADVAIVLGNDQRELFNAELMPAFLVYAGAEIENIYPDVAEQERLEKLGLMTATDGHVPPGGATYPGAPTQANAVVATLMRAGFDVAVSNEMPKPGGAAHGISHAFGFILRRMMRDCPPPTVPIFSNVGEGLNQPRLARMLAFGHAIKQAIDELPADLRVALIASGGFSHFTVDEAFDREVIAAMRAGDEAALASLPESYFIGNTCETKSWYPLVAAMNDFGRTMEVIDYVPCYRSEAGTGQAMVFASWQ